MTLRSLLFACFMMFSVHYAVADPVNLKQNMKQMKIEFKKAAEAPNISTMKVAISHLKTLVDQLKHGHYPPEKTAVYLEGFNKLTVTLNKIDGELDLLDLKQAKITLRDVDKLRKEYHKKRNDSIWSRLFG